jgi:hypothetical protein
MQLVEALSEARTRHDDYDGVSGKKCEWEVEVRHHWKRKITFKYSDGVWSLYENGHPVETILISVDEWNSDLWEVAYY